jgi:hypothetical protein
MPHLTDLNNTNHKQHYFNMNITAEQPRIKPSNTQLKQEYKQMLALVEHNGSRPAKCNPITEAAKQFGYTRPGIARLMNGKVDRWKPQHFAIYDFLKSYLT